jgi:hypothetical protein
MQVPHNNLIAYLPTVNYIHAAALSRKSGLDILKPKTHQPVAETPELRKFRLHRNPFWNKNHIATKFLYWARATPFSPFRRPARAFLF